MIMDEKTYEALKIVIKMAFRSGRIPPNWSLTLRTPEDEAYKQVKEWIDKVKGGKDEN